MRTVVTKDMVAHLFANQAQDNARTSTHNFYFVGRVCNSYGGHYVAAVHHGDTVLINSNRYSVTTASQLSLLRQACSHKHVYEVANPSADSKQEHRRNFAGLVSEYETEMLRVSRARVYKDLNAAEYMLANANGYAKRFKIGNRLKPIALENAKAVAAQRTAKDNAAYKRELKASAKAEEIRRANAIQSAQIKVAAWRAGEYSGSLWNIPVMVRLDNDGDLVQTSHGADFPVSHARKWIDFVLATMQAGKTWERNGDKMNLGAFQIDKVTPESLIAGCHNVALSEVEHLATLLKGVNTQ